MKFVTQELDAVLPVEQQARAVWELVERLEECLEKAQGQVKRLAEEREHPDPGESLWERTAQERVVRERLARVEQALAQLP